MARRRLSVFMAIVVLLLLMPDPAFAYLDPGAGNMLMQGLLALIGSVLTTIVFYRRAAGNFLRHLFQRKPSSRSGAEGRAE